MSGITFRIVSSLLVYFLRSGTHRSNSRCHRIGSVYTRVDISVHARHPERFSETLCRRWLFVEQFLYIYKRTWSLSDYVPLVSEERKLNKIDCCDITLKGHTSHRTPTHTYTLCTIYTFYVVGYIWTKRINFGTKSIKIPIFYWHWTIIIPRGEAANVRTCVHETYIHLK